MKLIVGLGNPGEIYAKNRHNVGFMMMDKLREEWNFPEFKFSKKFDAEISEDNLKLKIKNHKILLVKPQTFMNCSGEAVKKIMKFYKSKPADLIVIHDDLDIDLGKHKISTDSSAAGHNGVQSIIDSLGTKNFKRLRIGIEGTQLRQKRKIPGDEFVLKNFTTEEFKVIKKILSEAVHLIEKKFII
jgi:PTH1 family peptidyl-tRNA hydrolase